MDLVSVKEKNSYATSELVLLLYASNLLKIELDFRIDVENIIWNRRQRRNGGAITDCC